MSDHGSTDIRPAVERPSKRSRKAQRRARRPRRRALPDPRPFIPTWAANVVPADALQVVPRAVYELLNDRQRERLARLSLVLAAWRDYRLFVPARCRERAADLFCIAVSASLWPYRRVTPRRLRDWWERAQDGVVNLIDWRGAGARARKFCLLRNSHLTREGAN